MSSPALIALSVAWLSPAAFAAGVQAPASREPLPAREVERPILVPKGWTDLAATAQLQGRRGNRQWAENLAIRRGLLPNHEVGISLSFTGGTEVRPSLGWRWSLFRREPPSTELAVEASWSDPGEVVAGLAFRRQIGGLRLTARVAGVQDYSEATLSGRGSLEALLQAGLLVFAATPEVALDGAEVSSDLQLRGAIQWTRGFDTAVLFGVPLVGEDNRRTIGVRVGGRY